MAGVLAACDPSPAVTELPHDLAVVQVYDARTGGWVEEVAGHLESGEAFLHEGHLLQVTEHGVEDRGFAAVSQLSEADATWTTDAALAMPKLEDWVLVLGSDMEAAHHVRAAELLGGESFAFGGRVFESAQVGDLLAVRATGDVVGRVVDTFVRPAPEVIDVEISYADGTVDGLTGTPNHPFWVGAVRDYVPLGELEVGTVPHVQGGGEAVLVSKTWRQGDFDVFDFEVEGLHNFYVRGPGGDAAGVLVHNSTGGSFPKKNIGVQHPNRKSAKEAAAHAHGGKPRPTPPKTDKKKRKAYAEQQKYKKPEGHPNSKHPESHYHDSNKSTAKDRGKPNVHHSYPE